jgi:hypothetical protein
MACISQPIYVDRHAEERDADNFVPYSLFLTLLRNESECDVVVVV